MSDYLSNNRLVQWVYYHTSFLIYKKRDDNNTEFSWFLRGLSKIMSEKHSAHCPAQN